MTEEKGDKYLIDKFALQKLVGEFKIVIESLEEFNKTIIENYKKYIQEWLVSLYGDRVRDTFPK